MRQMLSLCSASLLATMNFVFPALADQNETPPHVDLSAPHDQPPYPDGAQVNGEQGVVLVGVYVRPNGKPSKIRVSQSSGFADLDNAAIEGVLNWRFSPAIRDGEAVSEWTTVKIVYQLPSPPKPTPASMTAPPTH